MKTRDDQLMIFWRQADFGYVRERLSEMTVLCEPQLAVSFSVKNRSLFHAFVNCTPFHFKKFYNLGVKFCVVSHCVSDQSYV